MPCARCSSWPSQDPHPFPPGILQQCRRQFFPEHDPHERRRAAVPDLAHELDGVPLDAATNLIASRFVEQAITSVIIVLLSLTQVSWIASSLRISPLLIYGALGSRSP